MLGKYYKPNNTTLLYLNSSFNCLKSSTISLAVQTAGSGYTSAPTIAITTASGDTGSGATATCSLTSGTVSSITMTNTGSGYSSLPTITLSGGGNPGVITGYSGLVGGSGYKLPPTLSISGGGSGSGFAGYTTLTATSVSSTFTITNGGTGYITGDTVIFDNTGTGGSNAVATVVATSGVITGINLTNAGSGYTLKAPTITSITSTAGKGAVITCSLNATSVGSIVITNGGSNYSSAVSFVFTATSGGSGAAATPTINLGTSAVITPSFLRTYSYTWNVPDIEINDLAKLSALNIVATGTSTTTPYTYRVSNLQIDSRNSYFSDYGSPILSVAQNTNITNIGSLGAGEYSIILTPQTIRQIIITVDDSITTKGSGQLGNINFVIALELIEFNPTYQEKTDVYQEAAANRLRPHY